MFIGEKFLTCNITSTSGKRVLGQKWAEIQGLVNNLLSDFGYPLISCLNDHG